MTQTYAEARAAQLKWLLPHLHAEHERLMNLRESTLTGVALGERGSQILRRQAGEIEQNMEEL
jgi:hypothetical protein